MLVPNAAIPGTEAQQDPTKCLWTSECQAARQRRLLVHPWPPWNFPAGLGVVSDEPIRTLRYGA